MEQPDIKTILQDIATALRLLAEASINPKNKLLVDIKEAAEMLSLSERTVNQMCKDGIFQPAVKGTSKKRAILVSELIEYAEKIKKGGDGKFYTKEQKKQLVATEMQKIKGKNRPARRIGEPKTNKKQIVKSESMTRWDAVFNKIRKKNNL